MMRAWTADRRAGLAAALLGMALLTVAALAFGEATEMIPLLVAGPLLAAWRSGPGETAIAGAVAIFLALLIGVVEGTFLDARHVIGTLAVLVGAPLSILVVRAREGERVARRRTALLAHAGEVLDTEDPRGELDRIAAMAVPDIADLAVVDLREEDGTARAAAVISRDPRLARDLRTLRNRSPLPPDAEHPVSAVVRTGEAQLVPFMDDEQLARFAVSDAHRVFMQEWRYRSAIIVPLTARGRRVGALSWLRMAGREPFTRTELALAREVARRAGLAIDHARLFGA